MAARISTALDDSVAALLGGALGFFIGIAGAFVIRYGPGTSLGLLLALVAFASAAVFTRALAGPWAFVPFVLGTAAGIATSAFVTFGDDVVLPMDRTATIWLAGVAVVANVVAFLPRRWFAVRIPDDDAPLAYDAAVPGGSPEPGVGPGVGESSGSPQALDWPEAPEGPDSATPRV
ncbi:MAG: hypothetical protein Q4G64_05630 [bacterium]|nr:hypothetical protein [bacterium]